MRVNHRRAHIAMTQEFLNAANVDTGVEQVRRKRMAQRMRADFLWDLSFDNRARNRTAHSLIVLMIATQDPGSWIQRQARLRKHPEPGPRAASPREFGSHAIWQIHSPVSCWRDLRPTTSTHSRAVA